MFLRVEQIRNNRDENVQKCIVENNVEAVARNLSDKRFTYYAISIDANGTPHLSEVVEKAGSRVRTAIVESFELEANGTVIGTGSQEV